MLDVVQNAIINDFLYSNEVCYQAFLGSGWYDCQKLKMFVDKVSSTNRKILNENYVSLNYGDKYFSNEDAKMIDLIREKIQSDYVENRLNKREFDVLLASLIYSLDRCANTVGHYNEKIRLQKNSRRNNKLLQ